MASFNLKAATRQVDKETNHDVVPLHFGFLLGQLLTFQLKPEMFEFRAAEVRECQFKIKVKAFEME